MGYVELFSCWVNVWSCWVDVGSTLGSAYAGSIDIIASPFDGKIWVPQEGLEAFRRDSGQNVLCGTLGPPDGTLNSLIFATILQEMLLE